MQCNYSSARPGSSVAASSMIPPYPGSVARARDRVQALQAYFQQPSNAGGGAVRTAVMSGARRSNSHRVVPPPQVGAVASSSDQQQAGGFYFYPSGRSFQEAENPGAPNRYHSWDREHLPAFNLTPQQVDSRDPIWGPFHQAAGSGGGGSDSGIRSSNFRQRHGSERMPSQNR